MASFQHILRPPSRLPIWAVTAWLALSPVALLSTKADTLISKTTFSYTGGTQSYTVPSNTSYLIIKQWGAGGGCTRGVCYGGAGAFTQGKLGVSPGQVYSVYAAGGGSSDDPGGNTGGGGPSYVVGYSQEILAGGGGGAQTDNDYDNGGNAGPGAGGGAGGGGGGNGDGPGVGATDYFSSGFTSTSEMMTSSFVYAPNEGDVDYPGGNIGSGGGIGIYDGNPGYVVIAAYSVPPVTPVITSPTTASGLQNQYFSYQITAANLPTSFGASGLPTGLSVNTSTGLISGTPTVLGTTSATISATNTAGTGYSGLTITINYADVFLSKTTFSYTGSTQNYTVPSNTSNIIVKAWGAGGGSTYGTCYGGAGAFTQGKLNVTPAQVYSVVVGGGGNAGSPGGSTAGGAPSYVVGYSQEMLAGGGGGAQTDNDLDNGGNGGPGAGGGAGAGGGGNSAGPGVGAQDYFSANFTSRIELMTSSFVNAPNQGDTDYPGGNIGSGGGVGISDGNPGYIVVAAYHNDAPVITSSLQDNVLVSTSTSYTITATAVNPITSYGASGLPPGLSVNTSTGVISGTPTTAGSYSSTISSTNAAGTGTATLTWNISQIVPNGSVTPTPGVLAQALTLVRAGTCNFGVAWTENTMWHPDGSQESLGDAGLGSSSYTPSAGTGTYIYQFRLVDTYHLYKDQWISFTVVPPPPTSLYASLVGSTFINIAWTAPSVPAGVDHYIVFRNGTSLGTATSTSYSDSGLTAATSYTYQVETVDTLGLVSPLSSPLSVTTLSPLEVFTPLP